MYEYIKEEFPMNHFWIGLIVTRVFDSFKFCIINTGLR